ncbi:MAG: hypothetical protein AAFV07_02565 [Bacteroidota bacterium]
MRKGDLSSNQLKRLNLFHLITEAYGWEDPHDTEVRMEAGEDLNPEGYRIFRKPGLCLEALFHAPVDMLSLRLSDLHNKERVQFHFLFDHKPERIVEWVVSVADELDINTYPELLQEANGKCEMILLEVSDTEIYEVKPPTKA